ncbi:hypothetical protein [Streptomyces sp. SID13031]|uniref:hypothetical protein n=1 Tax=Streptomyces sp. SID13031 TaxID=2706046 RepID=UPI0013CD801B|nr:hypothetical protein [Streptomyces sp. SID13031]NEA31454.1 hypothetical protein [Streptomyces sp. SID13031]
MLKFLASTDHPRVVRNADNQQATTRSVGVGDIFQTGVCIGMAVYPTLDQLPIGRVRA